MADLDSMHGLECIKTGANVFLSEHDAVIHGDLYQCGNAYLLSCVGCEELIYLKPGQRCMINMVFDRATQMESNYMWVAVSHWAHSFEYNGQQINPESNER